ncbi:MAG TPA: YdaU family protein [Burkholderiaceae bacterium]|nr:YdaU family protein [Burkholderiaceae bacterium]
MTRASVPFVALYASDFLADVGHLGNTELGIYWRLLLVYYRDRRPLPFDTDRLRRLAMAFSPEEQRAVDVVVAEFFCLSLEPDGTRCWRHKRADAEIKRADERLAAKRAGAAKARARLSPKAQEDDTCPDVRTDIRSKSVLISGGEPEPEPELKEIHREPTVLVDSAAPTQPETAVIDKKTRAIPDCPSQRLVALWHEHLPTLPRVQVWSDARRRALTARWREVCAEFRAEQDIERAAMDWFAWLFAERVAKSAFLTGRARDWRANFDWLLKPTNFVKVAEGFYAKERA